MAAAPAAPPFDPAKATVYVAGTTRGYVLSPELQKGFIASLASKTEAEILLESQMKAELEASIKQLKVRAAARFPTETLVDV